MIISKGLENELLSLSLLDIERHLKEHQWKKVEHLNKKVIVFQGPVDNEGNKIEFFLPTSRQYQDYETRIKDAIRVISLVEGKEIDTLVSEIALTSHDIFKVRIIETGPAGTIPLSVAANEVEALKNLLVYSACSEHKSLPFYEKPSSVGLNFADQCQFSHTFHGSFGFTINSPIIDNYVQLSLFEEAEERPFERRVMERIITSLNLIETSVIDENPSLLVDSFDIGLNSRMCESLLEISQFKSTDVIFNISWSPKIAVPKNLLDKTSWHLNSKAFELIEYAADELKKVEPYLETVIGRIVTLHSSRNPMSDDLFNRQITVKYELDGKTIDVKIDLNKEEYSKALDAHRKGSPIKIVGKLFRKGNTWRMTDIDEISIVLK